MKLLIVTAAAQFQHELSGLLRKANIENFSGSGIDGYKNSSSLLRTSSWFPGERGGVESHLFFAFTTEEKIDTLVQLVKTFNENMETNNPIKMVVVPIEKYV